MSIDSFIRIDIFEDKSMFSSEHTHNFGPIPVLIKHRTIIWHSSEQIQEGLKSWNYMHILKSQIIIFSITMNFQVLYSKYWHRPLTKTMLT